MPSNHPVIPLSECKRLVSPLLSAVALVALLALPELAFAQDFEDDACAFIGNIRNLLTIASVAVVTIAIIFAGYQIAFAHKRISDVAPILIGGLLIGAAGQLATWLLGGDETDCTTSTTMLADVVRYLA